MPRPSKIVRLHPTHAAIKPLLIGVTPIPGESLLSMLSRAAVENVHERLAQILAFADAPMYRPGYAPYTQIERAESIARLLSVPTQEIRSRMHASLGTRLVDWYGTPLRRHYLEARLRRVAPGGFGSPPHHKAMWMIKALPYCSDTAEILISSCPACQKPLGWTATLGVFSCENCGRSLRRGRPKKLPWDVRPDALAAAQVVSPDPAKRLEIIRQLPFPFSEWEGGDIFDAIVELGAIANRPDDASTVRNLRRGRRDRIDATDIVAGYRLVKDWPSSFVSLVRTVVVKNSSEGEKVRNTALGPLKTFFTPKGPDTPLRRLIHLELPNAFAKMQLPTRRFSHSKVFRGAPIESRRLRLPPVRPRTSAQPGVITRSAAIQQFHIAKRRLDRLDQGGHCLLRTANSPKAVPYYIRSLLAKSVKMCRSALGPGQVARRLGLPEFVIPAVCEACSVDKVQDADAVLLRDEIALYEPLAIDEFIRALRRIPVRPSKSSASLAAAIGGRRLEPQAWATVISALIRGAIPVTAKAHANKPPLEALRVDPSYVEKALRKIEIQIPADVYVTTRDAARLLGQNLVLITSLVHQGVIKAERRSKHPKISLRELDSFRRNFLSSEQAARLLGIWSNEADLRSAHPALVGRIVSNRLSEMRIKPIRARHQHRVIWRREDVVTAIAQNSAIRRTDRASHNLPRGHGIALCGAVATAFEAGNH
jgi:hypothetical protein